MSRISVLRALPISAVLMVITVAMVLVMNAHWRWGAGVMALAATGAGLLRLVLPESVIGVLAVRGRTFDVLFCAGIALGLTAVVFFRITP